MLHSDQTSTRKDGDIPLWDWIRFLCAALILVYSVTLGKPLPGPNQKVVQMQLPAAHPKI